jgi:glycosyltransferase involved in cell wall biosynthesis
MILLDLQNCDAAYAPTEFQKSRFPAEYLPKIQVIFDGVDRSVYHGHGETWRPPVKSRGPRTVAGVTVPPGKRIVTYVSRGFESMRGFDIFIRTANRIAELYPDVIFIVVGTDRIAYGGDEGYIQGAKTFKEWVLAREKIDPSKFAFVGRIRPHDLALLLASTDLHIYLTVPFVLSWSMMDAMSCGAVVLASATSPVKEMIRDCENGLLVDFFDVETMAKRATEVLTDPDAFRPLGRAAEQMIADRYSLEASLPKMLKLYEQTAAGKVSG